MHMQASFIAKVGGQNISKPWPIAVGAVAIIGWVAWLLLALSASSAEWLPSWLSLGTSKVDEVFTRRGQFGDAFGAFNALVSTLALIALLFTLKTQQDQLIAQDRISEGNDLLVRQQQFQEQYYRAIESYRSLLAEVAVSDRNGIVLHGRSALNYLWQTRFVGAIDLYDCGDFEYAVSLQLEELENERMGIWSPDKIVGGKIEHLIQQASTNLRVTSLWFERIGSAWAKMDAANRFQLDAMFRAWYTAYRILGTSTSYKIDPATLRLYSAIFRAQLSWIELAFLLANQSALPGTQKYPKASVVSNNFAMFDNLDPSHDVVVALLRWKVFQTPRDTKGSLQSEAFGSTDRNSDPSSLTSS